MSSARERRTKLEDAMVSPSTSRCKQEVSKLGRRMVVLSCHEVLLRSEKGGGAAADDQSHPSAFLHLAGDYEQRRLDLHDRQVGRASGHEDDRRGLRAPAFWLPPGTDEQ